MRKKNEVILPKNPAPLKQWLTLIENEWLEEYLQELTEIQTPWGEALIAGSLLHYGVPKVRTKTFSYNTIFFDQICLWAKSFEQDLVDETFRTAFFAHNRVQDAFTNLIKNEHKQQNEYLWNELALSRETFETGMNFVSVLSELYPSDFSALKNSINQLDAEISAFIKEQDAESILEQNSFRSLKLMQSNTINQYWWNQVPKTDFFENFEFEEFI